jgi:hypothetical protein
LLGPLQDFPQDEGTRRVRRAFSPVPLKMLKQLVKLLRQRPTHAAEITNGANPTNSDQT